MLYLLVFGSHLTLIFLLASSVLSKLTELYIKNIPAEKKGSYSLNRKIKKRTKIKFANIVELHDNAVLLSSP